MSPPKRRCHSPWLMMTTRAAPCFSSSGMKARPSIGCAPQQREEVGRDARAVDPLRLVAARQVDGPRVERRHLLKGLTLLPVVGEVAVRAGDAVVAEFACDGCLSHTITSRSASSKAAGCSSTALTTLKMAVFAPMPSASVTTATTETPGLFRSIRIP